MYRAVFNYSLPLMGASLVGIALQAANQFFISRYYGQVIFAEFSNGYISIPFIGMISGSVTSILLPLFSKAEVQGALNEALGVYNRAVKKSINLVYPLILFCLFFAKDIVSIIFGEQYEISKSYLQISLIKDVAEVIPYFSVLLALGKSNVYFYVHIIYAILIWVIDFIIVKSGLPPTAIALSSSLIQIALAASCFVYIYVKLRITLIPVSLIKHLLQIVLHLSIVLTFLMLCKRWFMSTWTSLFSLIVIGIIYYIMIILTGRLFKVDYGTEILARVKMIFK